MKVFSKTTLVLLALFVMIGCGRKHYHCYCSYNSSNPEHYESDYGTAFTYHEKDYQNACKANEQKQGIDKCTLQ